MRSRVTKEFMGHHATLPADVRAQARRAYRLWLANSKHRGVDFKKVHTTEPIWSARVGIGWRAIGSVEGDLVTWFWIGPHAEYDSLLRRF